MKRYKYAVKASVSAVAFTLVMSSGLTSKASVLLTLTDATSRAESGFVGTVAGYGTFSSDGLIGIYDFNASGLAGVSSLWSTCISPLGELDWNQHAYTLESFGGASPGYNPADWAPGAEGDAGIQNAQYLWRLYSPTIIASGNSAEGAGLELAMWAALYNSESYGVLGGTAFSISTWAGGTGTGSAYYYYNQYLGGLNLAGVSANLGTGSVFEDSSVATGGPATPGAGQELIYNVTPVPEPTTIIAGALLLLPFGASTLRVFRKNRAA
jgi:hypothetical protein